MIRAMKLFIFVLLINVSLAEIKEENNVLVLDKLTHDKALKEYSNLLLEFYAPWCGHCKSLEPEYIKAAELLKEKGSDVRLAKIDATIETDLALQYNVEGFPTLKFVKDGKAMEYTGGRTAQTIVQWIEKKLGPTCIQVENEEMLDQLTSSNKVVITGFFKDQSSANAKLFESIATEDDKHTYAYVNDHTLWETHNAKDSSILLLKSFEEKEVKFADEFESDKIKAFIKENSRPYIFELNEINNADIFDTEIKQFILMILDSEKNPELLEMARGIAKKFGQDVVFIHVQAEGEASSGILQLLGLKEEDIPAFAAYNLEKSLPYIPHQKDFTEKNLLVFVQDFVAGKLKPKLKSAELPEDWDKNVVKILVSSNFDNVTLDKSKDVFVEFYAPWCGHCQALAPIWEELGEKYKDSETVLIAKIDGTENDLENVELEGFPTLKIFKKDTNEVVDYNGARNLEDLIKFLETGEQEDDASFEELEDDDYDEEVGEEEGDYPDFNEFDDDQDDDLQDVIQGAENDDTIIPPKEEL